jgi:hypothetical protein
MGKSFKAATKQPKKNNACKAIRAQYEEQESEQAMRNYVGTSFLTIRKEDDNEDL